MAKILTSAPWSEAHRELPPPEVPPTPTIDNSVYNKICPRTNKIHRWIIEDGEIFCKDCLEPKPKRKETKSE